VKDVSQSYLTKLWNQDIFQKDKKNRMITIADTISKYFTIAVLLIAAGSAIYWLPGNIPLALNAFTAVLIVACPCALALSAPFTLGNTLRIFSKNRFYVKNTTVIEAISKTDTIVFDKTGTLTGTGTDSVTWNDPDHPDEPLSDQEKQFIKTIAAQSIHPLSQRISRFIGADVLAGITRFKEIPGSGIEGIINGIQVRIGSERFTGVQNDSSDSTNVSFVHIEIDGKYRGYFRLGNSYRKGLEDLLNNLKKTYRLSMISGDNDTEKSYLKKIFGGGSELKFNQSPHKKLEYIKNLQSHKNQVMMIGDGLNDAGALKQSDVGIAVSEKISGFSPACDGILQAESFAKLDRFIRFSRMSMNIIVISFIISFLYNFIGLGFAVQGTLSPLISAVLMPVSSITVMIFTTGATNLMAARAGLRPKAGER
ncbi:MAG: HAD-IC family P-type ATPase, partial [Calditrichaceae bacterium]